MTLFKREKETFLFYTNEGKRVARDTEVRLDPLTGASSRIVFDPGFTPPKQDFIKVAEQTRGKNCPFCPENVIKVTPRFPEEVVPEGRVSYGEAIVAPNLFPYSKYNGVTIMTEDHFVKLEEFSSERIQNAFYASQFYIEAVQKKESTSLYRSINWNYLPQSGGSILHPHLHVIISKSPTNYQRQFDYHAKRFEKEKGSSYFTILYEKEKELGERFIGEVGAVSLLHSFAPKNHLDFLVLFPEKSRINELNEADWNDFGQVVQSIFKTFNEYSIQSFNMLLHESHANSPLHARFVPRLILNELGTSDMNFFQTVHEEPLVYKVPEDVTKIARKYI